MGFVRDLTGATAADAAMTAGRNQYQGAQQAMGMIGDAYSQALSPLQALATGEGQLSYLQNNPMFQAAIGSSSEQLKRNAALQGKFGSGGLVNDLFQNYLAQGETFIGNQFNRQNLIGNYLTQGATQRADLLTGGIAAREAGRIGAANARGAGAAGLVSLGTSLALAPVSGGGSLGGGSVFGNLFGK